MVIEARRACLKVTQAGQNAGSAGAVFGHTNQAEVIPHIWRGTHTSPEHTAPHRTTPRTGGGTVSHLLWLRPCLEGECMAYKDEC